MPAPARAPSGGGGAAWRHLLLLLTALPLVLTLLAFALQWRGGGVDDPGSRWPPRLAKPTPSRLSLHSSSSSACVEVHPRLLRPRLPLPPRLVLPLRRAGEPPPQGVQTSTSAGLDQILPWLFYYRVIGVTHFLLFVEGRAAKPSVAGVLESIPGVKVVYRTKELEEQQARSRIWNETWLAGFFYKPCNYELFVKQSLDMEMAIAMARLCLFLAYHNYCKGCWHGLDHASRHR